MPAAGKRRIEPQAAGSDQEELQNGEDEQQTPGEALEPEGDILFGPQEQPEEHEDGAASGLAAAKILSRSELDGRAAATQRLEKRNVSGTDSSAAGEPSASLQTTYGTGADWSQFKGTAGQENLTETSTGKTGRSSDRQPGQRRPERAMGHALATTGTLATPAAERHQQDLSQAGRRAAAHGTLGRVQETETEPSSMSSTSSTPRSGHRDLDALSPVQSDTEAAPSEAAAARHSHQCTRAMSSAAAYTTPTLARRQQACFYEFFDRATTRVRQFRG
jgi:hypothetical protein